MTEYRFDRKRELRENLERLADEETLDQNALTQIAKDLEITSQAEAAKARLKTKGVDAVEREDREEARKCVDNLLKKAKAAAHDKQKNREQFYQKVNKVAKVVGIVAAGLGVINVPVYVTAQYWNSRDEALEALAKYDKLVKIEDPQERAEVISHLDEILEEHYCDLQSDTAAENYLTSLEKNGHTISEGAKILDTVGDYLSYDDTIHPKRAGKITADYLTFLAGNGYTISEGKKILKIIKNNVLIQGDPNSIFNGPIQQFDLFLKAKNIDIQKGECLLQNSKGAANSGNLIIVLDRKSTRLNSS